LEKVEPKTYFLCEVNRKYNKKQPLEKVEPKTYFLCEVNRKYNKKQPLEKVQAKQTEPKDTFYAK
jgi:hypothetical protein